jgi:hypothetical protein
MKTEGHDQTKGSGSSCRAEVERTGDKKQEKQTIGTANKNKETPMAGVAVSVTVSSWPSCTMQT